MTVATTTNKITYTCDGATQDFPYTFKIFANADLEVILKEIATGVETTLTLTTHYAVTGAGDSAGGTVTTVATYSAAYTITLRRILDIIQELDYIVGGSFPAEDHEQGLDRITMICQQLSEMLDRAALLAPSSSTADLTIPEPDSGKVLGWNAAGNDLVNIDVSAGYASSGNVKNKAAAYSITEDLEWVMCTGTFTVTLPAATTGYMVWVTNKSTGIVTVQRAGADTIEGIAQIFIPDQYATVCLKADGVDTWIRI